MIERKQDKIYPFLRWTGSKRWFVKSHVSEFLPKRFNNYHEPFLGGGAMFFYIKQNLDSIDREYFLSDLNCELINTYLEIRDNPEDVIYHLKRFKNTKEEYYKIRDLNPRTNSKRAAKFVYLNRTSFNGIYRVNNNGGYNVPYGNRKNVDIVTEQLVRNVSTALENVSLKIESFENSLEKINKDDFVFLDPPYTVAHENNGFIEYNKKLFSWDDQEKLKMIIERIIEKEAFFVLTNASHISIQKLYKDIANILVLSRPSIIGGRIKTRRVYNEVVISNL